MKKQLIISVCFALAASLSPLGAAETKDLDKTLDDSSASTKQKMTAIQKYVDGVENDISSYTRKEESLTADSVKKVTDESWTKIHGYFDGQDLKRMKLYPSAGSQKTEEFYFYENGPVFVFIEENGAGKEGNDKDASGSKYYFAEGELIAAIAPDGKSMDVESDQAKKMSSKLKKESTAFRGMMK